MGRRTEFDIVRAVRFRVARALGRLTVLSRNVTLGRHVDIVGSPIIDLYPGSTIVIGDWASLISSGFATALSVNHALVLRTLRPTARILIGDGAGISGGSICAAECVEIGANTMLGANVTIADTDFHPLAVHSRHVRGHEHASISVAPVVVGRGVFIGTNAMILKGVRIGDNSVIGGGSVVTRDVPANCIAAGNPCRVIRQLSIEERAS